MSGWCAPAVARGRSGRASGAGPFLSQEMDEKGGVRCHLRPPERLPRSFPMRSSIARSTFGGGELSRASSNSPQVSAGRLTWRRITLVKESRLLRFKEERSLYASSSMVMVRPMHESCTNVAALSTTRRSRRSSIRHPSHSAHNSYAPFPNPKPGLKIPTDFALSTTGCDGLPCSSHVFRLVILKFEISLALGIWCLELFRPGFPQCRIATACPP